MCEKKVRSLANCYENTLPPIRKCSSHLEMLNPRHLPLVCSVRTSLCAGTPNGRWCEFACRIKIWRPLIHLSVCPLLHPHHTTVQYTHSTSKLKYSKCFRRMVKRRLLYSNISSLITRCEKGID